eukprot:355566-Chlamydomonas_euryale.AAC.1
MACSTSLRPANWAKTKYLSVRTIRKDLYKSMHPCNQRGHRASCFFAVSTSHDGGAPQPGQLYGVGGGCCRTCHPLGGRACTHACARPVGPRSWSRNAPGKQLPVRPYTGEGNGKRSFSEARRLKQGTLRPEGTHEGLLSKRCGARACYRNVCSQ